MTTLLARTGAARVFEKASIQWNGIRQAKRFGAGVFIVAESSIRNMVKYQPNAGPVVEPVRNFKAGADFKHMTEILPVAAQIGAGSDAGRHNDAVAEVKIREHAPIGKSGWVCGRSDTGERFEQPPAIAASIFKTEFCSIGIVQRVVISRADGKEGRVVRVARFGECGDADHECQNEGPVTCWKSKNDQPEWSEGRQRVLPKALSMQPSCPMA